MLIPSTAQAGGIEQDPVTLMWWAHYHTATAFERAFQKEYNRFLYMPTRSLYS